jgi:alanine racemase
MNAPAPPLRRRVQVEIDLDALVRNYRRIAAHVHPADVLCVLKANAYGLGVTAYARALADAGCRRFGVAEAYEALDLQRIFADAPTAPRVQILSSVLPDEIEPMIRAGVILPVVDLPAARLISETARRLGTTAVVHLKIDTGMGRLGILADEARDVIRRAAALDHLELEGIFTHFPVAYDPADPFTGRQIASFKRILADARRDGILFKVVHVAASDAINNFAVCARAPFTLVRAGINLHGSFDPNGRKTLKVEPVLTLRTRVAQVRTLPAGATLGYGRTWRLAAPTRVATISAGYADGLPLALANRGHVLIGGAVCPVIGRVSMDYTTVDVTNAGDVRPGDDVICLGRSGPHQVTPDDWAHLKGTHAYEIICSLGSRVARIVTGGPKAGEK